jgi:asparagine synthase (glutamine-hydrolysing)
MCGFAGVVAFDERFAADRKTIERMSACVAHRGPDGEGIWMDERPGRPRVALAHRRLAILDPDPRSNQPFTDGKRWLVFNGEIYNFLDLKARLSPRNWRTTGDTEVLLAAYEKWGENCVDHLNGMFAFAVWDSQNDSLFLGRDRMGQKPLYWAIKRAESGISAVAFASEINAIKPVRWLERPIDQSAVNDYLRWGYIPAPRTVYADISQLEPATTLTIGATGLGGKTTYFNPERERQPEEVEVDPVKETRLLLRQAVSRQLISDVPLGCFLSGGVDSSIIAAAMRASVDRDQRVLTFSIGFDDPQYDETKYAIKVAKHLGTEHRSFVVKPDAAEVLPKLAAGFGEPFGDSSALPTHYLSRETRRHVKVALSGDGGDELFCGYERYRAMALIAKIGPRPWKLLNPFVDTGYAHPKSTLGKLRRLAAAAELEEGERFLSFMRIFDEPLLRELAGSEYSPDTCMARLNFRHLRQFKGTVEAAMSLDRMTYLPGDLLTKVDRCSMNHALEVRSPFMDHDLVTFASKLPAGELLRGGPKSLLRRAFAADLPAWVFKRKKMGFAVPIGDWFRTSLRSMLRDTLLAKDSFGAGNFQKAVTEKIIDDHQEKRADHSQRLYALLMLELWWRAGKARFKA